MRDGHRTLEQSSSSDNIDGAGAEKSDAGESAESAEEDNQHPATARNTSEEPKSANVSSSSAAPELQEPTANKTTEPKDKNRELEKVLYIPLNEVTL